MFVEMEQMASRPFSVVEVEIEKRNTNHNNQIPTISVSSNLRKRKIVSVPQIMFIIMYFINTGMDFTCGLIF